MVQKLSFYWQLKIPGYTIRFHLKKSDSSLLIHYIGESGYKLIIVCIIWLLVLELSSLLSCNLSYNFPLIRLLSI
jgi:hypothetical protein